MSFLQFFIFSQIDPLEKEVDTVKEMYELIDKFKVPTPPEDFAVYQVRFFSKLIPLSFPKWKYHRFTSLFRLLDIGLLTFVQSLRPTLGTTKNCIDKAVGDRDQNVDKLAKCLDKDIEELNQEVKSLKQEAQVSLFINSFNFTLFYERSTHIFRALIVSIRSKSNVLLESNNSRYGFWTWKSPRSTCETTKSNDRYSEAGVHLQIISEEL